MTVEAPPPPRFIRGDSDGSGTLDIADGVRILSFLFIDGSGPGLPCEDAADVNDDGTIEITDAVVVLGHLFVGSDAPARPFPLPGVDETQDGLECDTGLTG